MTTLCTEKKQCKNCHRWNIFGFCRINVYYIFLQWITAYFSKSHWLSRSVSVSEFLHRHKFKVIWYYWYWCCAQTQVQSHLLVSVLVLCSRLHQTWISYCFNSSTLWIHSPYTFITLCAMPSGAVYCNRSCLFVCLFVCLWVCYHDNSKLRASIFTGSVGEGSDHLQLIKFWPSCALGRGSAAGQKFLAPPYYNHRSVCVSLSAFSL